MVSYQRHDRTRNLSTTKQLQAASKTRRHQGRYRFKSLCTKPSRNLREKDIKDNNNNTSMKKYTKLNQGGSRKSDEITETPDRTVSSRERGKKKLGRGSNNSFAPLQTEDNEEEEEVDDTSMKEATEESAGSKTIASEDPSRNKDNTKYGASEDSMGGKSDGSSNIPIPSVLAKTAGTPGARNS